MAYNCISFGVCEENKKMWNINVSINGVRINYALLASATSIQSRDLVFKSIIKLSVFSIH